MPLDAQLRKVIVYSLVKPHPTGSGAQVRVYTTVRAYLDLGSDVELVWLHPRKADLSAPQGLEVRFTPVEAQPASPSAWTRMLYRLGLSKQATLDVLFQFCRQTWREIQRREQNAPGVLHHLEYLDLACAAVGLPRGRFIWSNHDFDSERFGRIQEMRREAGKTKKKETRQSLQYKRMQQAERWTADACDLVLTIAEHETEIYRRLWGGDNIHLLPMSWPVETPVTRARAWMQDGKLRLFHLGSVNSMVPFSSMRFILEEVFPKIPPHVMERVELWVAGDNAEGPYSRQIFQLAPRWPQVRFLGFVNDIEPLLAQVDLQVVGSQFASGLRTRIIESFARGVPVLSTDVAAQGVVGMQRGENILLAADARQFAEEIINLFANPERLESLSRNAMAAYRQHYARDVEAGVLKELLDRYCS